MVFEFEPIGWVRSCFQDKFGIPRQPGLATGAEAVIKLKDDPHLKNAVRELEQFSHLWVIFVFHKNGSKNWKPSIRPPRLGGAKKVGVLASRSPHRPNPIGLSVVKLERVDVDAPGGVEIIVSGIDLLDETPVLDIKPYIAYADSVPDANSGWADEPIERTPVVFTDQSLQAIAKRNDSEKYPRLKELIEDMLGLDPRPAFQKRKLPVEAPESQLTQYGFRIFDLDVKWRIVDRKFEALDVVDWVPVGKKKPAVTQSE